jgi:hypothetical protein
MTKILKLLILPIGLLGCNFIPSDAYLESDDLKSNLSIKDMDGTYLISNKSLEQLKKYYNAEQIDSMKFSSIVIRSADSLIAMHHVPLNESFEGKYVISSGVGKLFVTNSNHEKFRGIERPDSPYPNLMFRQKNSENSILVNLSYDPDVYDYYEYLLKK